MHPCNKHWAGGSWCLAPRRWVLGPKYIVLLLCVMSGACRADLDCDGGDLFPPFLPFHSPIQPTQGLPSCLCVLVNNNMKCFLYKYTSGSGRFCSHSFDEGNHCRVCAHQAGVYGHIPLAFFRLMHLCIKWSLYSQKTISLSWSIEN